MQGHAQNARQSAVHSTADQEYPLRLKARQATRAALADADARDSHVRLATFAAAVGLALAAWNGLVSGWTLLLPGLLFVWILRQHARTLRDLELAGHGVSFYERALARIEDRWISHGEPGERFRDDTHVYANDLDLFGRGSLFQLLSLARTRAGESTLAGWLTAPADPLVVAGRQSAVAELAPLLDLRERLAVSGIDVRAAVGTDRLLAWAEARLHPARALRAVLWFFTAATIAGIVHLAVTSVWVPLLVLTALHAAVLRAFRDPLDAMLSAREPGSNASFVADDLAHRARDLAVLTGILELLENSRFTGERLVQLQKDFAEDGRPASARIRQLRRLSDLHDSLTNMAAVPLILFLGGAATGQTWMLTFALAVSAVMLLVRPHLALAIERWRARFGRRVRVWVNTIAEFEALSSLAGYRYEHPDDPFPQIVTQETADRRGARFDGVGLGHPLLRAGTMVRNDVRLAGETRLLVVSGSNMSGKSTLLRTVGINTVLAFAGAPVRAVSLRLSPLSLGATLRIQDSLIEGRSRFYAEITRIRQLADIAAGSPPLLFLLDELFHGTNSHDRLAGAQGVLLSLLERGAIGLITTHDLALTAVAGQLAPRALNVHFEDWFEAGEMRFDYRMKPGPVTRSNALALMRAVGLDVAT